MSAQEGSKVFVGDLPSDIREDELRYVFSTYGPVSEVSIMPPSTVHPGTTCAFVVYSMCEGAKTAIRALHRVYRFRSDQPAPVSVSMTRSADEPSSKLEAPTGSQPTNAVVGKPSEQTQEVVARSTPWKTARVSCPASCYKKPTPPQVPVEVKLFVGNLPSDVQEEEIRYVFGAYGAVGGVHLMPANKSKSGQACAFVLCQSKEGAQTATRALHGVYRFRADQPWGPISVTSARPVEEIATPCRGGGSGPKRRKWETTEPTMELDQSQQPWYQKNFSPAPASLLPEGVTIEPRGSFRIFVGDLPGDVLNETVHAVFSTYGDVKKAEVIKKSTSHSGQACAFVEYYELIAAQTAILMLHLKYEMKQGCGKISVRFASNRQRYH